MAFWATLGFAENPMKSAAFILALLAAITGGIAARKWYVASRVNFLPFEERGGPTGGSFHGRRPNVD